MEYSTVVGLSVSRYSAKKIDDEIRKVHREIAALAEERLAEFRRIWESGDDTALFAELAFCLLTPQSGARRCAQAVERLKKSGNLFHGGFDDICPDLNIVRFKNNKTRYLIEAREKFWSGGVSLRELLGECGDARSMRKLLVDSVRGIGFKEASHFLRNIGLGEDLAILDRHVLRVMAGLELLGSVPVVAGGQAASRSRNHCPGRSTSSWKSGSENMPPAPACPWATSISCSSTWLRGTSSSRRSDQVFFNLSARS